MPGGYVQEAPENPGLELASENGLSERELSHPPSSGPPLQAWIILTFL